MPFVQYIPLILQTTIKTYLNSITIHDKEFVPFINSDEIAKRVSDLATQVNFDYKDKNPLLNGCFMFAADLMKALNTPPVKWRLFAFPVLWRAMASIMTARDATGKIFIN